MNCFVYSYLLNFIVDFLTTNKCYINLSIHSLAHVVFLQCLVRATPKLYPCQSKCSYVRRYCSNIMQCYTYMPLATAQSQCSPIMTTATVLSNNLVSFGLRFLPIHHWTIDTSRRQPAAYRSQHSDSIAISFGFYPRRTMDANRRAIVHGIRPKYPYTCRLVTVRCQSSNFS